MLQKMAGESDLLKNALMLSTFCLPTIGVISMELCEKSFGGWLFLGACCRKALQEPKRTHKAKNRANSTKEFAEQFDGVTGSLPSKTRVLRQIAPESSPERSAKSLSRSFFVVPLLSPSYDDTPRRYGLLCLKPTIIVLLWGLRSVLLSCTSSYPLTNKQCTSSFPLTNKHDVQRHIWAAACSCEEGKKHKSAPLLSETPQNEIHACKTR